MKGRTENGENQGKWTLLTLSMALSWDFQVLGCDSVSWVTVHPVHPISPHFPFHFLFFFFLVNLSLCNTLAYGGVMRVWMIDFWGSVEPQTRVYSPCHPRRGVWGEFLSPIICLQLCALLVHMRLLLKKKKKSSVSKLLLEATLNEEKAFICYICLPCPLWGRRTGLARICMSKFSGWNDVDVGAVGCCKSPWWCCWPGLMVLWWLVCVLYHGQWYLWQNLHYY